MESNRGPSKRVSASLEGLCAKRRAISKSSSDIVTSHGGAACFLLGLFFPNYLCILNGGQHHFSGPRLDRHIQPACVPKPKADKKMDRLPQKSPRRRVAEDPLRGLPPLRGHAPPGPRRSRLRASGLRGAGAASRPREAAGRETHRFLYNVYVHASCMHLYTCIIFTSVPWYYRYIYIYILICVYIYICICICVEVYMGRGQHLGTHEIVMFLFPGQHCFRSSMEQKRQRVPYSKPPARFLQLEKPRPWLTWQVPSR